MTMNTDLAKKISDTIRRVDGSHTMGAALLGEHIAEVMTVELAQRANYERVRIVREIRAIAQSIRVTSQNGMAGNAVAAIVDEVSDRINAETAGSTS